MTFVIYNAQQKKRVLINLELKGKCGFFNLFWDVRICAFRCQGMRKRLHLDNNNKCILNQRYFKLTFALYILLPLLFPSILTAIKKGAKYNRNLVNKNIFIFLASGHRSKFIRFNTSLRVTKSNY